MYDQRTGQPKFWLYRYGQTAGGVPVFRGGLLTLVRNDASNAVVWASSSVKDMSAFRPAVGLKPRAPDGGRSLAAIRGTTDFAGRFLGAPTTVARVSAPDVVVFAGTEDRTAAPRMAIQYTAETAPGGLLRLVADASTGEVARREPDRVRRRDRERGRQRHPGDVAMECAEEASTAFRSPRSMARARGRVHGRQRRLHAGQQRRGPLSVSSPMGGQFFDVFNLADARDADQLGHPARDGELPSQLREPDPRVVAQVNGYANANQMRAFLLKYLPTYPVISTQTNFPVKVNLSSANTSTCPGNAFYDGSAINFCIGSSSFTNTSFASVSHHEYGHHIITSGGSGQGEYGEGTADSVAVLQSGQHGLAYAFLNQCTNPLRDADNTCQFPRPGARAAAARSTPGNLMSGTIWSIQRRWR
jgi:hypothetical protein